MNTSLSVAFLAGLISFLSPCVLPLIPGYISYISGTSLEKLIEKKNNFILIKTIFFALGFSSGTATLHLFGVIIGSLLIKNNYSLFLLRFIGIASACYGAYLFI